MRAALYARVSTEDQAEKYGLSSQLTELRELAAKKGFTVPEGGEFVDDAYSGATLDRPALNRLREAVRAGTFDVLLVHDPDRLSRKLGHKLLLEEEFERAGAALEYLTTPRENTPEGRLLGYVKGAVAEYEREKIRERTTRGKKQKAREGRFPGGSCPYGYRSDPAHPGGLGIHNDEARVVREMFRWLAEGASIREVVARLNRLPIAPKPPRGKRWAKSTVRRILTSETYAGRAYYNRRESTSNGTRRFRPESEHIAISVPAIIEGAMFKRVQEQLARNQGMLKGRPPTRVYLLRGLLRCGDCGRRMKGVPTPRRRYRCSGRDRLEGDARCKAPAVSADRIERVVWETIEHGLKDPRVLMGKVREHRAVERRGIEVRSEVTQVETDLERVQTRRERLLDSMMDGDLEKAVFRDKLAELETQERSLREHLTRARAKLAQEETQRARENGALRFCRLAQRGLARLDDKGRQKLVATLVEKAVAKGDRIELHTVLPVQVEGPGPSRREGHYRTDYARLRPASLVRPHGRGVQLPWPFGAAAGSTVIWSFSRS